MGSRPLQALCLEGRVASGQNIFRQISFPATLCGDDPRTRCPEFTGLSIWSPHCTHSGQLGGLALDLAFPSFAAK